MPKTATLIRCLFLGFVIQASGIAAAVAAEEPLWREARRHGWKVRGTVQGKSFELIDIENGRPIYYITCNADAAISTGANLLHNPPYSLDGNDLTIGLWDAGWVLASHQEFDDRVTIMDSNSEPDRPDLNPNHATHVAGTIGAQGVDPNAKGMAPAVSIDSYDWYSDTYEMAGRAATGDGEDGRIYLSNHSYAVIAGWELGIFRAIPGDFNGDDIVNFIDFAILAANWREPDHDPFVDIAPWPYGDGIVDLLDLAVLTDHWLEFSVEQPYWFGVWGEREDRNFGRYDYHAADWDSVCYLAPYYLPFKAAGNDRSNDDDAPANGTKFWYLDPNDPTDANDPNGGRWVQRIYNVNDPNAPYDDGRDSGGYDTIPTISTAKNIMTVGAVDDTGAMVGFSSWGPTDDGRIKPDIVANGFELYSPVAVNDVSYDIYSGTGMASANATGSAVLLVEYYNKCFPGEAMRASTLKGLIIHTATDLSNPGPDYRYGWGLMDANQAADYIRQDADDPNGERIIENVLAGGTSNTYTFTIGSSKPVRATLCWTDPPGTPIVESNDVVLDNNTPCLMNDLDLRIIDNNDPNIIYYPYRLDPNNPDAAAVADANGNILDNVEQVYIPSPNAGTYTVKISHKGTLTGGSQYYSLILSEPIPICYIWVDDDANDDPGPGDPTVSDPLEDGSSEHPFDSIQKAVDAGDDDTIVVVRDGTYTGVGNYNIDPGGKALTITSKYRSLNHDCTIDCESNGRAFIFQSGETATTVLDGFTIKNGFAEDLNWPQQPDADPSGYGGAIYCEGSSPWISNCLIIENEAEAGGGAIFCYENSNAIISDCQISLNDCGTGLDKYYYDMNDFNDINLRGGGIYCKNASPTIINCIVGGVWEAGNKAGDAGGGIACEDSNAVIINCTVSHNDCGTQTPYYFFRDGGGIHCDGGSLRIYNSTIEWNTTIDSGGGIAVLESEARIDNCAITDNRCWASGGGIFTWGEDSNTVSVITNCVIAYNVGGFSGAMNSGCNSFVEIENCTITNNIGAYPYVSEGQPIGGLECYFGSASVTNSIIWGNIGLSIGTSDMDVNDVNDIVVVTYSDIQMFDSNGVINPVAVWDGEGNINEDPLFADLELPDYHLKSSSGRWDPEDPLNQQGWVFDSITSPCIDKGDPSSNYSLEPAPNGGRINMGAYGNTRQASKSGG